MRSWISTLCTSALVFFGIQASLAGAGRIRGRAESHMGHVFPAWFWCALNDLAAVSALSTLDSALSSAATAGGS